MNSAQVVSSYRAAHVVDIRGHSGLEEDSDDDHHHSHSKKKSHNIVPPPSRHKKPLDFLGRELDRVKKAREKERLEEEATKPTPSDLLTGENPQCDCHCQPGWLGCGGRCIKVTTAVRIVTWSETILNTFLSVFCLYLVMVWTNHYKHAGRRGFLRKNEAWSNLMEDNEDGFYILLVSYTMMGVVSFWTALTFCNMTRIPPIAWCIAATYSTILQVVAVSYFPFCENIAVNCGVWLFKAYGFWVMCHYDYLLRNKDPGWKTRKEIEDGISVLEGHRRL